MAQMVLGGGCFWGMEQLFEQLEGVTDTEVGYAGGRNENPSYEDHPGHAEALLVTYDQTRLSLERLLDFFFTIHNPTTVNQQGNDIGSSYRSVIFYNSKEQKQTARQVIEKVNGSGEWDSHVVTTLEPLTAFYPAEPEHQDYLQKNPGGYTCHYQRRETYL